jgi:hypothetical protein
MIVSIVYHGVKGKSEVFSEKCSPLKDMRPPGEEKQRKNVKI